MKSRRITMQALLPRFDSQANRPVVFITDTEDTAPKTELQAWFPDGAGLRTVPMDFYKSTLQLSEQDKKVVVDEYVKFNNVVAFVTRDRLPYKKSKNLVNRISTQAANEPTAAPQNMQEQTKVLENIAAKPVTPRQKAARQRYQEDLMKSAATTLKDAAKTGDAEDKKKAAEELAQKIAQMLLNTLED
jgi:hypothetical protein